MVVEVHLQQLYNLKSQIYENYCCRCRKRWCTVAENIVRRELAEEIVLLDIKEGFAEGKAMDMNQTATLNGFDSKVIGSTNDYGKTAGSTVAVITSGIPRKPGMTREELIGTNAKIVQMVTENLIKYSPDIIIVVISNPMDTMTYLTSKTSGLPKTALLEWEGFWIQHVSNTVCLSS